MEEIDLGGGDNPLNIDQDAVCVIILLGFDSILKSFAGLRRCLCGTGLTIIPKQAQLQRLLSGYFPFFIRTRKCITCT